MDAAATEHAHQAAEAARREEVRQASIGEGAARASAIAEEATKLVAAHALAETRERENKMVVQASIALKAQQD
jgi:hypothetical protein